MTALGIHNLQGGTAYIPDVLSDLQGSAELSRGGVSGTSGDKDSNASILFHRHVRDTFIVLEEGNLSHLWCPCCNMLVPWCVLNGRHLSTAQCARGTERKRRRLEEEGLREILDRSFQAYMKPLETMTLFKYLGRLLKVGDET